MIGLNAKSVDQKRRAAPCKGCDFLSLSTLTCDYILMTEKRRPCPPGKGCTVKRVSSSKGKMDRDERLMQLYREGKNDVELVKLTGYAISSIRNWRKRNRLPAVVMGNPKHKHKKEET